MLCLEDVGDWGSGFILKMPSHLFRSKYLHWARYSVTCLSYSREQVRQAFDIYSEI